ncbi:MAG: ATP-binding protein [Methylohalobius sp. ZOD2]|nr:HAMP domain-containing sensor histidine kinase [Methylothermaceae bacterium]
MLRHFSLKTRLNLIIAAILIGIVALGSFLVIHRVRQSVAEETVSAMELARRTVEATYLQGPLSESMVQPWIAMLASLNQLRHVRLHVTRDRVLAPEPPAPEYGNPEIPRWFIKLIQPPPLRIEQLIPIREGGRLRVTLVADPRDEFLEAWHETRVFLGLFALLVLGFFIAVTIVLGRAFRPVDAILQGLQALERGNYHCRLPSFSDPDFNRIAAAFNHTVDVLEQTRSDNRNLTRQLLKVEEEERRLLARELHDELGQVLSAIKVMARSIQKGSDREPVVHAAKNITANVDHLFDIIRLMIQKLRPLMLDDLGLSAAIDTLVSGWREKQADTRLHLNCDPIVDRFPRDSQIHVYRIVQESLTNAFKHAHAKEIRVNLARQTSDVPRRRWMRIKVIDDGRGTKIDSSQGCGLRGMRERVESLGGRFEIRTEPGQGFTMCVWLPFEEEEEENAYAHSRHARG